MTKQRSAPTAHRSRHIPEGPNRPDLAPKIPLELAEFMAFFANPIQTWNQIQRYYNGENQTIGIGNKEWPVAELIVGLRNKIRTQDMPEDAKFGHTILIYLAQEITLAQTEANQWADVYKNKVRAIVEVAPPRSAIQSNFRS